MLQLKKILYRILAQTNNKNWPSYLKQATSNLNDRHLDALGGLRPSDIKFVLIFYYKITILISYFYRNSFFDVKIDEAKHGFKSPSLKKLNLEAQIYSKQSDKLQPGNYVYARTKEGKSGTFQRGFRQTVEFAANICNFALGATLLVFVLYRHMTFYTFRIQPFFALRKY